MFMKFPIIVPNNIIQQYDEIWFWVYEYISFSELQKTVIRDYTNIIVKYNPVFLIVSILSWLIWHIMWFIIAMSFLYLLIFVYIFIQLIFRVRLFVSLNKIIITDKWIIAWDTIFEYDDKNFMKYFKKIEKEFNEFLFQKSKLDAVIKKNRELFSKKMKKNFKDLFKNTNNLPLDSDDYKAELSIFIFYVLYTISAILFYYIWYVFAFIFSSILILFIKLYLYLKQDIELKIHQKALKVYDWLWKLKMLNLDINKKFSSFAGWEISNLWKFVDDKLAKFYKQFSKTNKSRLSLINLMQKSKYKNYINFENLQKYMKNSFNKPVLWMIDILQKYKNLIEKEIENIKKLKQQQTKQEYIANLTLKTNSLERQLETIKTNESKLKKMVL